MFLVSVRLYIAGVVYRDQGVMNYFACKVRIGTITALRTKDTSCMYKYFGVISTAANTNSSPRLALITHRCLPWG